MDAATFKAQYLAAAAKLEAAYSHCEIHSVTLNTNDANDYWFKTTFRLMRSGANVKCEHEFEDEHEKTSRTISSTPGISFTISSKNEQPSILEQVDRSPLGYHVGQQRVGSRADIGLKAFMLFGTPLSERLQSPGFKILSVEEQGELVKVTFQNDEEIASHRGWFVVAPRRQWVLDSWEAVLSKPEQNYTWRKDGKASYTDGETVPHLTEIVSHSYHPDRTDTEHTVVELVRFEQAPDSEFMLSNYGFDDRIGLPPSFFSSLPFYLAICGTGCLLLVAGIRYRLARRS